MAGGGSGVHLEIVPEVVVEEFIWPRESVITLFLRMEANTATVFASNIAPVTSTLVLKQVRCLSTFTQEHTLRAITDVSLKPFPQTVIVQLYLDCHALAFSQCRVCWVVV